MSSTFSNRLSVSNQTGLGSIVRVSVSTRESQSRVPSISGTGIPRAQASNDRLSSSSSTLSGGICSTDVGQLIMNSVGDDVGVQSLLLALVHQRVNSLEGRFSGGTAIKTSLKLHGGDTETKVKTSNGGCDETIESTSDGVGDCAGACCRSMQTIVDPEPVQVPAAADEAVPVDVAATAVAVAELATVTSVGADGAAHALAAAADDAATAATATEVAAAVSVAAAVAVAVSVPVPAVPRSEAATLVPS